MYEEFYGLTEKPFSIQPDPSFLYWGRGHRLAYAMLEYGVVNQAGISVVTGEVGCGKTTLIHRLLEQLSDTHTVALLSNIQAGRGELLSWVLMGFGEPYAGKTHVERFAQLQAFFIREYSKGKRVVLIIDEAQNLSVDMLEEIRMLSNINAGKDQLLQLILVGQPQLKDLLSRSDMLQLAQRIGSDFHLTPLSREEVHAYIETRLTIAGARRTIFTERAINLVAEQSRGVPRVINIIADTALVYAFSAQEEMVDAEMVRSVIRDKLDYGVFGLAASPDLKLAESNEPRRGGFLREAPASAPEPAEEEIRQAPRRAEARESPRAVANLKLAAAEPLRAEYEEEPEPRIGGPSLYESSSISALRSAFPAPAPAPREEEAESEPEPVLRAPPPEPAPPVKAIETPAPRAPLAAGKEIGVVVVGGDRDVTSSAHSAPEEALVVSVTTAGTAAAKAARDDGLEMVELDVNSIGGGRARNAGYRRLKKLSPNLKYVQFVEAGALVDPEWLQHASRFMARRPEVAALEGRTAETAPSKSGFQRLVDRARDAGEGEAQTTGPNALFRADAFEAAGGFRGDIVADETADLCIRLRRRGAHVWRTDDVMALVEPKTMSFAEWKKRCGAEGFLHAAGAALHGAPPERYRTSEQARAVMWGAVFPAAIVIAAIIAAVTTALFSYGGDPLAAAGGVLIAGVLLYALRIVVVAVANGPLRPFSWAWAAASTLGAFYEFGGVARYWFGRKNARKA